MEIEKPTKEPELLSTLKRLSWSNNEIERLTLLFHEARLSEADTSNYVDFITFHEEKTPLEVIRYIENDLRNKMKQRSVQKPAKMTIEPQVTTTTTKILTETVSSEFAGEIVISGVNAQGRRDLRIDTITDLPEEMKALKVSDSDIKNALRQRFKKMERAFKRLKTTTEIRLQFRDDDLEEEKCYHVGRLYFPDPAAKEVDQLRIQFLKRGSDHEEPEFFDYQFSFGIEVKGPLYSNQFVLVRGELQGRTSFYAHELVTEMPSDSKVVIERYIFGEAKPESSLGQMKKVVVMAGPFGPANTSPSDGLHLMLKKLKEEKPDCVFLLGPFIDEENEVAKKGVFRHGDQVDTVEEHMDKILRTIDQELSMADIPACFIPSTRDLALFDPLPQKPFQRKNGYAQCLPNPAQASVDNLFSLLFMNCDFVKETISACFFGDKSVNKIDAVFNEINNQQNLLPAYPTNTPVDFSQTSFFDLDTDDKFSVFISPSKMSEFIRLINGKLYINPGFLYKGNIGGSYLTMNLSLPRRETGGSQARYFIEAQIKKFKYEQTPSK